jgi:integrase
MRAYAVVSLLTGARTEELRALTWTHVDLEGTHGPSRYGARCGPAGRPRRGSPAAPSSCRRGRDALRVHRKSQRHVQLAAGDRWQGAGLVFCTSVGTALDPANVRRSFRRVAAAAGLDAQAWTPRELRHSFVSLLSSTGMRHLPPDWPRQQPRHRAGVPQGAAAGAHPRCERDGRPLPG